MRIWYKNSGFRLKKNEFVLRMRKPKDLKNLKLIKVDYSDTPCRFHKSQLYLKVAWQRYSACYSYRWTPCMCTRQCWQVDYCAIPTPV